MKDERIFDMIIEDFECLKEDIADLEKNYREKWNDILNKNEINDYDAIKEKINNSIDKARDIKLFKDKISDFQDEFNSLIKEETEDSNNNVIDEFVDRDNFTFTDPMQIKLFDKTIDVNKSWRVVLTTVIEEMIKLKPDIVKHFDQNDVLKGRKKGYFSYNENDLRTPYKLSNGLFVETNLSANFIAVLCRRIVSECGYDPKLLKYKTVDTKDESSEKEADIICDKNDEIKLPSKYASIHITKDLFKTIVNEIVNYDTNYNEQYIIPSKLSEGLRDIIIKNSTYSLPYHVIINIIQYLKDCHFIENYPGTKRGKYILKDKNALNMWIGSVI